MKIIECGKQMNNSITLINFSLTLFKMLQQNVSAETDISVWLSVFSSTFLVKRKFAHTEIRVLHY